MVNYDKVCNNVFKDNIKRVQKIFKQIIQFFLFFNLPLNDWRELDSLISFPKQL